METFSAVSNSVLRVISKGYTQFVPLFVRCITDKRSFQARMSLILKRFLECAFETQRVVLLELTAMLGKKIDHHAAGVGACVRIESFRRVATAPGMSQALNAGNA